MEHSGAQRIISTMAPCRMQLLYGNNTCSTLHCHVVKFMENIWRCLLAGFAPGVHGGTSVAHSPLKIPESDRYN